MSPPPLPTSRMRIGPVQDGARRRSSRRIARPPPMRLKNARNRCVDSSSAAREAALVQDLGIAGARLPVHGRRSPIQARGVGPRARRRPRGDAHEPADEVGPPAEPRDTRFAEGREREQPAADAARRGALARGARRRRIARSPRAIASASRSALRSASDMPSPVIGSGAPAASPVATTFPRTRSRTRRPSGPMPRTGAVSSGAPPRNRATTSSPDAPRRTARAAEHRDVRVVAAGREVDLALLREPDLDAVADVEPAHVGREPDPSRTVRAARRRTGSGGRRPRRSSARRKPSGNGFSLVDDDAGLAGASEQPGVEPLPPDAEPVSFGEVALDRARRRGPRAGNPDIRGKGGGSSPISRSAATPWGRRPSPHGFGRGKRTLVAEDHGQSAAGEAVAERRSRDSSSCDGHVKHASRLSRIHLFTPRRA